MMFPVKTSSTALARHVLNGIALGAILFSTTACVFEPLDSERGDHNRGGYERHDRGDNEHREYRSAPNHGDDRYHDGDR